MVVAERVKVLSEVDGGSQGRGVVVAPGLAEVPQGVLVEFARGVVVAERMKDQGEVVGDVESVGVVVAVEAAASAEDVLAELACLVEMARYPVGADKRVRDPERLAVIRAEAVAPQPVNARSEAEGVWDLAGVQEVHRRLHRCCLQAGVVAALGREGEKVGEQAAPGWPGAWRPGAFRGIGGDDRLGVRADLIRLRGAGAEDGLGEAVHREAVIVQAGQGRAGQGSHEVVAFQRVWQAGREAARELARGGDQPADGDGLRGQEGADLRQGRRVLVGRAQPVAGRERWPPTACPGR